MDTFLEQSIRERAGYRCEYCQLPESKSALRHVGDHIIARQHGGTTVTENLALCCGRCNLYKGPNIAGLDPESGKLTHLFNPRAENWADHFRWHGGVLEGTTAVGRTTVAVLAINIPTRLAARQTLIRFGQFFPKGDITDT